MSFIDKVDEISGNRKVKKAWFRLVCVVFLVLVILPSVYVLFEAAARWDEIGGVISDSAQMSMMWGAIGNSFGLALAVTVVDIIAGIPMAWLMVRKDFPGKKLVDTLIDMPLAFPTAALGFSVAIFWGMPSGLTVPGTGLVASPMLLVFLLHLIFTYPYMVRTLSGILEQIDPNYETAGMTLGASKFTAVRTITLPLFRAGLITGFILCFARSLSETGGTYIALSLVGQQNSFFTGPTLIKNLKELSGSAAATPTLILVSAILIILAIAMLLIARSLMERVKVPWSKVWPRFERKISRGRSSALSNALTVGFFLFIILVPSFFIFTFLTPGGAGMDTVNLLSAIGTSFLVAGCATAFGIVFGMPMAFFIARNGNSKTGKILDSLINIPLIIPTTALGLSLALFWKSLPLGIPGLILVIFGHIAFTYPLIVRNIIGAMEEVDPSYEEIAKTLGAKPSQAFRKVLLPIIKSSVLAGAILAFTRSLGETGATLAIDNNINTVPIYIVKLIDGFTSTANEALAHEAALSSVVLIILSFILMALMKYFTSKAGGK